MESRESAVLSAFQFEDITDKLNEVTASLKLGELLHEEKFSLYDSMSATEIGDPKTDLKYGLDDADTVPKLLAQGRLKPAQNLSTSELVGVLDQVLSLEMQWLTGYSLTHSLYTFVYLYDAALYQDCAPLRAVIESLFYWGQLAYDALRSTPFLREDDYAISIYSFPKIEKSYQELEQQFIQAEQAIADQITPSKKKRQKKGGLKLNEFDALDQRLKLQRALLSIFALLNEPPGAKQREDLEQLFSQCHKRLEEINESFNFAADVSQYFSNSILRTLLAQVSPRPPKPVTQRYGAEQVVVLTKVLEVYLRLPREDTVQAIYDTLDRHTKYGKNVFAKAYLDYQIYNQQQGSFGRALTLRDMIINEWVEMGNSKEDITSQAGELLTQCTIVVQSVVELYLKNKYRQHRALAKLYSDFSIILSFISQLKESKLKTALTAWGFVFALRQQARHLQLHFELELCDTQDYPFLLFYLDYVYSIMEKSSIMYVQTFDKEFLQAYQTGIQVEKKKKRLSDYQRKYFHEYLFERGVQLYCKTISRIAYVLVKYGVLPNSNTPDTYEYRFNNRFAIFENVYYIKQLDYQQYDTYMKDFVSKDGKEDIANMLIQLKDYIKQAIDIFKSIPQNDEQLLQSMRDDVAVLAQISVHVSLANLTLISNLDNLSSLKATVKNDLHPRYPYIEIKKQ